MSKHSSITFVCEVSDLDELEVEDNGEDTLTLAIGQNDVRLGIDNLLKLESFIARWTARQGWPKEES